MFALFCFGQFGGSGWQDVGDQAPVKRLAQEFGENYDLLDAKARVERYPESHKAAAQAHLEAVQAGKKAKAPTVHWPRAAKIEAKAKAKGAKG